MTPRKLTPAVLIGAVSVVALGSLTGCSKVLEAAEKSAATETVFTYALTGTGGDVKVNYTDLHADTSRSEGLALPWSKEITVNGKFASITAKNGENPGSVTCTITHEGKVVSTATKSGPGASATCSGSV